MSRDAYDDWNQDAAEAQETWRTDSSEGQAGAAASGDDPATGEIGLAAAELAAEEAAAAADYSYTLAVSSAASAVATAQAAMLSTLGGTGNYKASYPALETLVSTPSYTVAAASAYAYHYASGGYMPYVINPSNPCGFFTACGGQGRQYQRPTAVGNSSQAVHRTLPVDTIRLNADWPRNVLSRAITCEVANSRVSLPRHDLEKIGTVELVERQRAGQLWDQEIAGSNPVIPT